jgi:hypothetical protein
MLEAMKWVICYMVWEKLCGMLKLVIWDAKVVMCKYYIRSAERARNVGDIEAGKCCL